MRWLIRLFWPLLAASWTLFLFFGYGSLPALGPLLSVRDGIWNHRSISFPDSITLNLKEPVTVTFDASGVPHIFARHEVDLYRVQGYIMAAHRLFQMDLMTRLTAGQLSEWIGSRGLPLDEYYIKMGFRDSARDTLNKYLKDPHVAEMMQAFVDGINAYLKTDFPLPPEYKILQVRPEPFDSLKVLHMAKALTFSLAGRNFDTQLSRLQQLIGTDKVLDLFPDFLPDKYEDYIVNGQRKSGEPQKTPEPWTQFISKLETLPFIPFPDRGNGSNNWAVAAQRSTTGHSIFANDTHLALTLPNIWFENQLSTPEFNVYGTAIVALPGIVAGFHSDLAWGPTNGTTDVMDYHEIEFEDSKSMRYKFRGEWLDAMVKDETIKMKSGRNQTVPVVWTRLGTLVHREGSRGLVAQWLGHQTDNEFKAIRQLYESRTIDRCLESFHHWAAPIQNFICADKKDVGIQHAGSIPNRRWGEGRFIMDGSSMEARPFEVLPSQERPQLVRPGEGFVLSANQKVLSESSGRYMGWDYEEPFRGMLIRRHLQSQDKFSPEDFLKMQNASFDLEAEIILPKLLMAVRREGLSVEITSQLEALANWDFHVRADDIKPALYSAWYQALKAKTFDDEYKMDGRSFYPRDMRIAIMLERAMMNPSHADHGWFDDKTTEQKETVQDMVTLALQQAWKDLSEKMGPHSKNWVWRDWIRTRFTHVARLPGFGTEVLAQDGSGESIRSNKGWHGAVYKIVVAFDEWPKAWIQVPGGNVGDPFDRQFERFTKEWANGEMREVEYYRDVEEAKQKAARVIMFNPGGT